MKNKIKISNIFLVLFLLCTLLCIAQKTNNYKINFIDKKQYLNLVKDSVTLVNDFTFKKLYQNKHGIAIKTKLKNVVFKNNISVDEDNDSYKKYEYQYFIPNLNKHLVKFTFYEGSDYLLIDNKNSKMDTLASKPIIFNGNILVIYQDMEDADQFSTLKFYNSSIDNNLKLINIKKAKWILNKTTFLKDNKLVITVNSIKDDNIKYCIIEFEN